jgi:hypothetical protein
MQSTYSIKNDLFSSAAAILCAVHCLLLPLFFTTLPLFGWEILENFWLELSTILISLFAGGYAIYKGYFHFHKSKWVAGLFCFGIILMIMGNFSGTELFEYILKIMGATALLVSHIANWKKSHKKSCTLNA